VSSTSVSRGGARCGALGAPGSAVARATIFTLDSPRGGVPAVTRVVYDWLVASGHSPTLLYSATEEVPTGSTLRIARYFLGRPPVRGVLRDGMTAEATAAYPVRPRYQYHLPRLARAAVQAPIGAVVSGSSHVGLPRALAQRPYVLWVGTVYEDELRARAEAGDRWAQGLLRSRDWPILEAQEGLCYERASVVLVVSEYTRERIAQRWPGVVPRLRTVVCPVDTDRFRPGGGPSDPPYLLLTARIRDPRKNPALLLRAFARVGAAHPRLKLVIAGDEPTAEIRQLAVDLGVAERVQFAGYVPADELPALYRGATVFVFPSLQEGLGISVVEAMACGVPVVATRSGGPEGLVQEGLTGRLVPSGDVAALAEAIDGLLRNPERRSAMGAASREYALRHFARASIEALLRAAFREAHGDVFEA
jgi:D-inositol-3-phosphate glycosyltransferase